MTRLQVLARRRELVLMSCDMQRMTITRRLERVERRPAHAWLSAIVGLARHRWVRFAALAVVTRALQSSRKPLAKAP